MAAVKLTSYLLSPVQAPPGAVGLTPALPDAARATSSITSAATVVCMHALTHPARGASMAEMRPCISATTVSNPPLLPLLPSGPLPARAADRQCGCCRRQHRSSSTRGTRGSTRGTRVSRGAAITPAAAKQLSRSPWACRRPSSCASAAATPRRVPPTCTARPSTRLRHMHGGSRGVETPHGHAAWTHCGLQARWVDYNNVSLAAMHTPHAPAHLRCARSHKHVRPCTTCCHCRAAAARTRICTRGSVESSHPAQTHSAKSRTAGIACAVPQ